MLVVGITGLPGAGKSKAADILAGWGARVVNADEIGHDLLAADTPTGQAVVAAFGTDILDRDGEIVRARLAEQVFADEDRRARLEAIVHPALLERLRAAIADARAQPAGVTVIDAALIAEWGLEPDLDEVLYIRADQAVRRKRLALSRGWSDEEFDRRQAAQYDEERKARHADWVIDNNEGEETLVTRLQAPARAWGLQQEQT